MIIFGVIKKKLQKEEENIDWYSITTIQVLAITKENMFNQDIKRNGSRHERTRTTIYNIYYDNNASKKITTNINHNHENVISDDNGKDNNIIEIDIRKSSIDNDDEDISTLFNDNILNHLTFERNHKKMRAIAILL